MMALARSPCENKYYYYQKFLRIVHDIYFASWRHIAQSLFSIRQVATQNK